MKPGNIDRNAGASFRVLCALALLSLPLVLFAAIPSWWVARGVVDPSATPNDYGAVNQGQLKNIAVQAYHELQADLPASAWTNAAATNLTAFIDGLSLTNNNYAPVNLGQLKYVAKQFYDLLIATGNATNYPWANSTNAANDYAQANIGQVKNLFNVVDPDAGNTDSDGNGLPDWWEMAYFGHLGNNAGSVGANGLTLLQDYQQGLSPLGGGSGFGGANSPPTPGDNSPAPTVAPTAPPWQGTAHVESTDGYNQDEAYKQGNADPRFITVVWSTATAGVTGFVVERKRSTQPWTSVVTNSSTDSHFSDPDPQLANQQVQYRITPMYETQPGTPATTGYMLPLIKNIYAQTSQVNGAKPGFCLLTSPGGELKYYLKMVAYQTLAPLSPSTASGTFGITQTVLYHPDPSSGTIFSQIQSSDGSSSYFSSSGNTWVSIMGTLNAEGSNWNVTTNAFNGTRVTTTSSTGNPPFGLEAQGGPFVVATDPDHYHGSASDFGGIVTIDLSFSNEYTTAQLMEDTIASYPAFSDMETIEADGGFGGPSDGNVVFDKTWYVVNQTRRFGAYEMSDAKDDIGLMSSNYKFEFFAAAPNTTFSWLTLFVADDGTMKATLNNCEVGGSEDYVYSIRGEDNPKNGLNYIAPATEMAVYDGSSVLDDQQMAQSGAAVGLSLTGGSGEIYVDLRDFHFGNGVGQQIALNWGDVDDFQVWGWLNGQATQIFSGMELDADQWGGTFEVIASGSAVNGATTSLTMTETSTTGDVLGSTTSKFYYSHPVTISVPVEDASGALYRKVALNGRPLPDGKPQAAGESDQQPEETFIDALTLGLRHSVTDAYVPISGSELSLAARRNAESEVWNHLNGLLPAERPDLPFGPGWNSNLAANITIQAKPNDLVYATVTDENGASYRFAGWFDTATNAHFFPFPTSTHEQQTYLSTLTASGGTYTFKRKFGSTLVYNLVSNLTAQIPLNRVTAGDGTLMTIQYARLASVTDRLGQVVNYNYGGDRTLIPQTITVPGRPDLTLSIKLNADGHVSDIWDANWNHTTYQYQAYPCLDGYYANVLSTVHTPDGKVTTYAYTSVLEVDLTPRPANSLGDPLQYTHLDIASITDPNGKTYAFSYIPLGQPGSYYRLNFQSDASPGGYTGYYSATGNPSQVQTVTLPGGTASHFQNNSFIKITGTGTAAKLTDDSLRQTVVTDAAGNSRTYTWAGPKVCDVNTFQALANNSNINDPQIVYYTTMQVDYGSGIKENFTFDLNAGLAIASASDPSGNTTTYQHTDTWNAPADYRQVLPAGTGINGFYDDPNVQVDAFNHPKAFTYNSNRLMSSIIDEAGRKTVYLFDPSNQLRREEDIYSSASSGTPVQTTLYTYSSAFPGFMTQKKVKDLSGSADLVTNYVPDADGRVHQEIVDPGGLNLVTTTTYDANGNKLTSVDPNGRVTSFAYDKRNRLILVTYPDASTKSYAYDDRGNKISETDENGHATTYAYDGLNRLVNQTRVMNGGGNLVTQYGYNAVNSKTSVIDPDNHTNTFAYDALQRLTQVTDPLNHSTTYVYGANSGSTLFDSSTFKPTSITDPRAYVTTIDYDALHRPTRKSVAYQTGASSVTQTGYDAVGNPTDVTDPVGNLTHTDYDALNRPVLLTYADGNQLATAYTSTGLKATVTEIDTAHSVSRPTDIQYDKAGRPTYVLQPAVDDGSGTQARPTTQTVYDPAGNVVATINPLTNRWDYAYDARNRKIVETGPAVTNGVDGSFVRPASTNLFDGVGNPVGKIDPRGNTNSVVYDWANRPVTNTAPPVPVIGGGTAQPVTATAYDPVGNIVRVVDPNGHTVTNAYDACNRLLAATDGAGDTVRYGYDAVGNKTSVIDGASHTNTFAYDGLNRNTSVIDAANHSTVFRYDGLNKVQRTDALSQTTTYAYDARNRLANVVYASTNAVNSPRAYGYDAFGNLLTVTESAKPAANVAYTYDALNRVLTETSAGATHTNVFDLVGNRLQVTHGGTGSIITSTYDALNRPLVIGWSTYPTTYAYDLSGNVVSKTFPNGVTLSTYDALNRVQTLQNSHFGSLTENYAQTYDLVGNLVQSVETYRTTARNRTVANTYDGANRLTQEVQSGAVSHTTVYAYDAANNRTGKTVDSTATTYTVNTLNQLTAISGGETASYAYDLDGNRQSVTNGGATDTYGYDFENRLVTLAKNTAGGTGAYSYAYDYRTRRVQRTENGTLTNISFSGGTSAYEYASSPSSSTVEYVRGSDLGGGIGGILLTLRSGTILHNDYDARGDVVGQINPYGSIVYQAEYEAFGTRPLQNGSTLDRQRANTKDEDPTGLLNENFRYRDLDTGTFITRDPAGFVDGPNVYTYVNQNPWTKFDPEGLDAWTSAAGGFKVVGGSFEVTVGGSMAIAGGATSEFGVGIPVAMLGGTIALHGADTVQSGIREAATGKQVDSLTSTGLQKAGMSKNAANMTDATIGIAGSAGAGVGTGLAKVAIIKVTDEAAVGMSTSQIISATERGSQALPNAVFDALGGAATTPLTKAAMIKSGQVAGIGGVNLGKAITLAGTGLTPGADIGAGIGAAITQSVAAKMTGTSGSDQSLTPTSSARATAPPPQSPPPLAPSVKQ